MARAERAGGAWDLRLLRLAALGLIGAVWLLGMLAPRKGGLSSGFVAPFTLLLLVLALVYLTSPRADAPFWRRLLWFGAETALCYAIVRVQGSLIRPVLIYLLPASEALLLFGAVAGLVLSLAVWAAYVVNIWPGAWPHRLGDFPNYLSFFLAPYVVAILLTLTALREAAGRTRLQALYDELQAAHVELQELHRRAHEAAVTEERNRLAREIHDTLAHYLTIINVQLELAEKLAATDPDRAGEQVHRARRLTVECLQEVRRSVAAMRAASMEELTLPGALRRLCDAFATNTGIAIESAIGLADGAPLPPEVALALYRAAQEGLTNVQRHARATAVRLALEERDGTVDLALEDNGIGPPAEGGDATSGFGLLGLRERLALLGGSVRFGRGANGGGRLEVALPVAGWAGGVPGSPLVAGSRLPESLGRDEGVAVRGRP